MFHYRRRHGKRLIVQLVHPILQGNPKRKLSEILPKSLIDPPDPFTRNLIACTLLSSIVCFQRWRIELAHTWRTSEREQQNLILLNKTKNPRCIYRRSIQFVELVFVSVVRAQRQTIGIQLTMRNASIFLMEIFLKARKLSNISAQVTVARAHWNLKVERGMNSWSRRGILEKKFWNFFLAFEPREKVNKSYGLVSCQERGILWTGR